MIKSEQRNVIKKYQSFSIRFCETIVCHGLSCLVLCCLLMGLLNLDVASAADTDGAQPADQFKHFIEKPPMIAELFFESLYWDGGAVSYNTSYCHVKWQPNAEFVGFNDTTNFALGIGATNPGDFFAMDSRFDNVYWHKVDATYYVWTNRNDPDELTNNINTSEQMVAADTIYCVMNMGLAMMPPETIRWVGDSLSFTNRTKGMWYRGQLSRDSAGRAEETSLVFGKLGKLFPNGDDHFVSHYYYDEPLSLSFLPSRIETTNYEGGRVSSKTIKIHTVIIADRAMPLAEFSPVIMAGGLVDTITISNGYLISSAKPALGNVSLHIRDPMILRMREPAMQRWYFLVAVAVFSIPFIIFLLPKQFGKQNREDKKTTKAERK